MCRFPSIDRSPVSIRTGASLPVSSIHRSAWKGSPANFVLTAFYEVAVCAISSSRTGPRVPLEQIALHEGVDAALYGLEEGSHHHGRGEVGEPRSITHERLGGTEPASV